MTEDENEELVVEWSQEQLRKRSQELQLVDENGKCIVPLLDNRKDPEVIDRNRLTAEDGLVVEFDDGSKSASTTSDSQITVRSSPVTKKIDKLSVCRHCHKNCKQKSPKTSSLKVQHSQSSSSRCCASTSSQGSEKSVSSRTSNHSKSHNTNESKTSPKSQPPCDGSPSSQKTITTTTCSNSNALNNNILCKCKCTTADFQNTVRTSHEIRKETCKILNNVSEIQSISRVGNWQHANCYCDNVQTIRESKISNLNENEYIKSTSEISNVDDWSSKLIGSSQFRAIPNVMRDENDPFKAVPKISVVPPTPDGITNANLRRSHWEQMSSEQSPEDSPQDELPYRALNTSLKRYGTMSSLEKMPSDETDDKTYNSSDTETNDNDDDDIRIVTKEIYDGSTRNWTNRAGSFLEQSRAFLDSYLGRWDRGNQVPIPDEDRDDSVPENGEECTSGATSGEEIWGTPTSGENDEIQMFNSDQTSPTKSSSSLTGDDDTELMMDELLMAPPMTASTIRGLLPRRRLEPLFEEDTESSSESDENDENDERMVRDFSSSDQGQAAQKISTQNGRDVENDDVAITTTTTTIISSNNSNSNSNSSIVEPKSICTVNILPKVPVRNRCIVEPLRREIDCGGNADAGFSHAQQMQYQRPSLPTKDVVKEKQIKFADVIDLVGESYSAIAVNKSIGIETTATTATTTVYQTAIRLSPRLEMRLALNHDILGDEDLISFEPGPANLEAILGRDLSSYHKFTGKDLINYRTTNHHRIAPKEQNISFSTQKNSKMDTPTPNRRKSNLNTWNNSACAAAAIEKKLSDLERLARAEKKIQLKTYPAEPLSINHGQMAIAEPNSNRNEPKSRGFFGFFKRRNSDTHNTPNGKIATKASATAISLQKDADKSMDRRFWKQLNKRRRSLSEFSS